MAQWSLHTCMDDKLRQRCRLTRPACNTRHIKSGFVCNAQKTLEKELDSPAADMQTCVLHCQHLCCAETVRVNFPAVCIPRQQEQDVLAVSCTSKLDNETNRKKRGGGDDKSTASTNIKGILSIARGIESCNCCRVLVLAEEQEGITEGTGAKMAGRLCLGASGNPKTRQVTER